MNEYGEKDLQDEVDDSVATFRQKLASCGGGSFLSENVRARIERQISRILSDCDDDRTRCEQKQLDFVQQLVELPLKKLSKDIVIKAEREMDLSHSGMEDVKRLLIDQLRMTIMTDSRPQPLLLVGAPGCGKTSLAISFAEAIGCGWDKIQLSGMTGAFMLSGDDTSYKDAKPGRLMTALVNSGSLNPVVILDEVDKVGKSEQNGALLNALMEVLDSKQCESYTDHFLNIPFNMSKVRFILTANTLEGVPEPLLDRCTVYRVGGYSFVEKKEICSRIIMQMNRKLGKRKLVFREEQINELVLRDGSADGVRSLHALVERAFMMMSDEVMSSDDSTLIVRKSVIDSICRIVDPDLGYDFSPRPGVIKALVSGGGSGTLFPLEAVIVNEVIPDVRVTGMVERMLKESSEVAASVARRFIKEHFLSDISSVEIHYPYPVSKDGDSAGCAAAAAVVSAFTGRPMKEDFAITGAISLTGQVLSVGSALEKVMAARRLGFHNVILPKAIEQEFTSLPRAILRGINLHFVSDFEEVCALLFPSAISHAKVEKRCSAEKRENGLC